MTDEHTVTYDAEHKEAGFEEKQQYQIPLTYDVRSRRLLLGIVAAVVGALLCGMVAVTVAYLQSRGDVNTLQGKVNCGEKLTAEFGTSLALTVAAIGSGVETLEGGLYEAFITNDEEALMELMKSVPGQRENIKKQTEALVNAADERQEKLKEC